MRDLRARVQEAVPKARGGTTDFDLNPNAYRDATRSLTPAAVLIAITSDEQIILTRRSARLRHHAGQIALPGGKRDPGDLDLIGTALRETREEIGIPVERSDVIGQLGAHETVTGYLVTPVIALAPDRPPRAEPGEVAEIFNVPAAFLLDRRNYRTERRRWRDDWRYYNTIPYGPYYIWGATARMLRNLAEVIT